MIVCSCNILSDASVIAVLSAEQPPETIRQVYVRLGCEVQCGRCATTIKRLRTAGHHGNPHDCLKL